MATKKGSKVTIHKAGKKPISFHAGGLHASTHTPAGHKIPSSKLHKALEGGYGPKAKKQAEFAKNVLKKGQKTAASHRKKK